MVFVTLFMVMPIVDWDRWHCGILQKLMGRVSCCGKYWASQKWS